MTGKIAITSSQTTDRRLPLLPQKPLLVPSPASSSPLPSPTPLAQRFREKRGVGECAGGTAAECAAVCCCFPLILVEFLVLAFYKVPTGLCRRVCKKRLTKMEKKKKTERKKGLLDSHHDRQRKAASSSLDDSTSDVDFKDFEMVKVRSIDGSAELIDLDKEMWEHFHNSGFWRSPSQRYL